MIVVSRETSKNVEVIDPLARRPLLDADDADALTALYKVLANPHRLRLLHALARAGEMPVGVLADEVGMSVQAVSNQLQRLADSAYSPLGGRGIRRSTGSSTRASADYSNSACASSNRIPRCDSDAELRPAAMCDRAERLRSPTHPAIDAR